MSHTTHTNEEFSQVLTALLQERKKVQELEGHLLTLQEGRESDEGNEKIKSMFLMLKKKYAQALHALNDKEKRLHDLERIQSQYDELKTVYTQTAKKAEIAEEESLSLRQQHTTLVSHLNEAQQNSKRIQDQLDQTFGRLQESDLLRDAFEKENQELKSLQNEYKFLKVQAEASQLKADELTKKLSGSFEQEATIESLREERDKLANDLTENLKKTEELDKVIFSLNERIQESEGLASELHALRQKFHEAEQLKATHEAAILDKDQINKELQELKAALEERDARIKIAQQHLAKKVKETNQLLDKVEEQKLRISDLQSNLETHKHKISEMQHTLDMQIQQEKRIEENLLDSLKTAEIQARRWEEKYFLMSDKWQQSEAYGRDLKGLEEKFNQVQAVLASLGNIMSSVPVIQKPTKQEFQKPLSHGLDEDALF